MRTVSLKTLLKELHKGYNNESRTWTMDDLKDHLRKATGKSAEFIFWPGSGKYKRLSVNLSDVWKEDKKEA